MNAFGRRLRIQLFGESHGPGVGAVLDGVPPGLPIEVARIQADLDARRPGTSALVSQRKEEDRVRILSGTFGGHATGAPLALWIENQDADSKPYEATRHLPRPGHADWTSHAWSRGFADPRGGGHASGRLTAPLVAAGAVAQRILDAHGIAVGAHLHEVAGVGGPPHAHDAATMAARAARSPLRTAHAESEAEFTRTIEEARKSQDSVGGVIEFAADGLPVGLGDPLFDSVESLLAHLLFAIPAVKGVDFGAGFAATHMRGSQHNDPFDVRDGRVVQRTNNAGGILGGRTTGTTLRGRVAVKPTSTLPGRVQETVDLETMAATPLRETGRHDPCIAIRAVPAVQAAVRLVLADLVLQGYQDGILDVPDWRKA
jgi:chorismate synthase